MSIRLYNDDCKHIISALEDESLDSVITDPPYFIDKLGQDWDSKTISEDNANSHIKHLPKGMKFSKQQSDELYQYYFDLSKLILTKLKPGGYFLSFSSPRLYHAMAKAIDDAGFEIRDMINWVYVQTMPKGMGVQNQIERLNLTDAEKQVLKEKYKNYKTPQLKSCFEPICVAMKPIRTSFLQNEMKHGNGLVNFNATTGENRVPANIVTTEPINEFYDKNFIVRKPSKKEKGKNNVHVSVKPVELMAQLLELFTKENSIVLDPFMGSGTTGVACKRLGRKFIGVEKSPEYFRICEDRINAELETLDD